MKLSNRYLPIISGCRLKAVAIRAAVFALLMGTVLPLAAQTTRDPLVQPFAVDSIWNMPIGTGAQYVPINMAANPSNGIWTPMPQIDDEYIFLNPTAPLTNVNYSSAAWTGADRCNATGGLLLQMPFPTNYVVPNSMANNAAVFLMTDNRTLIHTQPITRCVAGGSATSLVVFSGVDIYGDGRYGSHGGSGLSAIGGSIRLGEFRPGKPIQHPVKIDVDTPVVLARCSSAGDCFRWPAFTADSGAAGSYGTQNPNPVPGMKMGALLAIPASTNINNLGLESVPGQMLAWTLQNYGAYIVDSTGGAAFVIAAETGPNGSVRDQFKADFGLDFEERVNSNTPWSRDLQRLIPALYLVDNNGPTSIGGGGTPLQPLALPLQLPGGADTAAPTVPGGLAATLASLQINLSWTASTDNVGVTGYKIFRNGVQVATTSSLTYADAGLLPLTLYSYTVAAFDAAGNASAQSAAVSASTLAALDTQAPTVPTGLVGTAASSTQVNLTWNPSTDNVGVLGYYVYVNNIALTTTATTSFAHTGLAAGITYNYRVSAYDAAGNNSAWTATPVTVTTPPAPDTQAPTVPTGMTATAVSPTQINLSWTASTDNVGIAGYRVYRTGVLLATLGAVTTYQNTGLAASTTYSYTVQAVDAAGNASAQSASASANTQATGDTTPPSVPTGLKGTAVSPTQINLTWKPSTDNVGVKGYYVYVNDVALATTTARSFTHTGLSAGTTYSYRVSAYDAAGNNSAWTATPVSVRTTGSRVIGSEFNSDRKSDILWRDGATGANRIWLMNGTTLSADVPTNTLSDLNYGVAGTGDFNGDGKSDILWHNRATGENAIWLMNGTALSGGAVFVTITDPNWSVAGVGDFNADGKSDIVWRNSATGQNMIYLMNGVTISSAATLATLAAPDWSIAGVGDFDGDGKSDILWRNGSTGENAIWFMNGTASASAPVGGLDLSWSIAGVGDFDGDGKSDILWHNSATGENTIWLMNGAALSGGGAVFATITDPNWSVAGVGDVDGDGKSDILWRNNTTGENVIYLMNGAAISSSAAINPLQGSDWSITLR
jgi:chitodextrinase